MNIFLDDRFFRIAPTVISLIAVLISILSYFYTRKKYELDKSKYEFEQEKYDEEVERELSKHKPLLVIRNAEIKNILELATLPRGESTIPFYRKGIIQPKKRQTFKFTGGVNYSVSETNYSFLEGQFVNWVNIKGCATIIIVNRGAVPLWVDRIVITVRIRAKPIRFPFTEKIIINPRFLLEWQCDLALPQQNVLGDSETLSSNVETVNRWLFSSFFYRKMEIANNVQSKLLPNLANILTQKSIDSDASSFLLEPDTNRRWLLNIDFAPQAVDFLVGHGYEIYALHIAVYEAGTCIASESTSPKITYNVICKRDSDFSTTVNEKDIAWKNE